MADRPEQTPDAAVKHAVQRLPVAIPLAAGVGDCAEALTWVAGILRKGLTQVYAVQLAECFESKHHTRLVERFRQTSGGSALTSGLEAALHGWSQAEPFERAALLERLGPLIFAGVDRVLEQAEAAGRDRTGAHLAVARFGHEVVILADPDPQLAWLLPTTQTRLREALAELSIYPTAAETQELDLARGDVLQLLGHQFRVTRERPGERRVHYQLMQPTETWHSTTEIPTTSAPAPVRGTRTSAIADSGSRVKVAGKPGPVPSPRKGHDEAAEAVEGNTGSSNVSMPPAPTLPEPPPLSDHRRRRYWHRAGPQRAVKLVEHLLHWTRSIEVGWRHLPITLYPVLAFICGWTTPTALLCAALIFVCNWRSLPAAVVYARRHWRAVLLTACGLDFLVCAFLLGSDLYANLPGEVPAPGRPRGFYWGQYSPSGWDGEPFLYGLYVPPDFRKLPGPFPLVVFLHGHGAITKSTGGAITKTMLLHGALPWSIIERFGADTANGSFGFVAFCPFDPTGRWQPGTVEVDGVMSALAYVMERHRIDPTRVYLTGLSSGGSGVWQLAEAYPDRWAAVAPVASFIEPDIAKVHHIPAWIFHGDTDSQAPVERARGLVRKLKVVQADVRYTEFPHKGHVLRREAYDTNDLFNWFAQKARK